MRDEIKIVGPLPATGREERVAERFGVGMPYTLADGQEGRTRDMSATGLSFDSVIEYAIGEIVELTLRYGLDGHNFPMPCKVEVVRVQREGDHFEVAAKMCRPFFDPAP